MQKQLLSELTVLQRTQNKPFQTVNSRHSSEPKKLLSGHFNQLKTITEWAHDISILTIIPEWADGTPANSKQILSELTAFEIHKTGWIQGISIEL